MYLPHFIARKIRFGNVIAFVCIAVSFLVILIAVAVSCGFRNEIRSGVSAISGDVQLAPRSMDLLNGSDPVDSEPSYIGAIRAIEGVDSISAAVYRGGLVKTDDAVHGVIFKGIGGVSTDSLPMAVSIPRKLADLLSLSEGDRLVSYFVGEKVKVRNFNIASVYQEILSADDKLVVYADIDDLRRLNGWEADQASAIEITVDPAHRDVRGLNYVEEHAGTLASLLTEGTDEDALVSQSVATKYPQLFAWLELIDTNVLLVLVLMLIVAGFNMISGLLIIILDNISRIGLLKALGMRDGDISKAFLEVAARLVLKGMLAGNLIAVTFCLVQGSTHFVSLNPENYFIDFVPVSLSLGQVAAIDVISFAAIMLMLLLPIRLVSRIDPARTVRAN
ncbi:MAG: ABC transporter permease [Bacteroidales bacterium]|nr:ABC transporter permease [Bacteroidales bacterium]